MNTRELSEEAQGILDRLLAVDSVFLPGPGRPKVDALQIILRELEKLASLSGTEKGLNHQLQLCRDKVGVVVANTQSSNTAKMPVSKEAASAATQLAVTARALLRELSEDTGNERTNNLDKVVYMVPAGSVLVFMLVYFSTGMVATLQNSIQVYWHGNGQTYQERNSLRLCAVMDNQWRRYEFAIPDSGVTQVRLDPAADGRLVHSIEVRRIAYSNNQNGPWRTRQLASGGCQNCRSEILGDYIKITPNGIDPWVELPSFGDEGISRVRVEARMSPARLWPWRWLQIFTGQEEPGPACAEPL